MIIRKTVLISIIILIVVTAFVFAYQHRVDSKYVSLLEENTEVFERSTDYAKLARACIEKTSVSCCMASQRRMVANQGTLVSEGGCPQGTQKNMLKCPDSYQWCEKINQ